MGCVPSSDARNSSVDARASADAGKPQQNVELQTKTTTKAEKSSEATPIAAPKATDSEMDRGSTDKSTPPETSPPSSAETKAEPAQDESTDTDATSNAASAALVVDTKPLESLTLRPKADTKADSDELMLDFKTFILIPEVQQVLAEGAVKTSMLQDLFDIVDKDADGFVNDIEREDLLELISLSYGAKSKPSTPLNRELDPLLPPVPTLVLSAPAPMPVEPEPVAPAETDATSKAEQTATDGQSETEKKTDKNTDKKTEEGEKGAEKEAEKETKKEEEKVDEKGTEKDAEKNANKETEENDGGVSPLSSEASTSTKSAKRKPKIIKFISPSLVVPGAAQGEEAKSAETTEDQSPSTPVTPTSAAAKEAAARDLPPQKKGFMVTRRERESLGSRDSSEQGQSRFFCLDNGKLSFMDSTSRKPPFSMTHREIALKGVDVQVKGTAIELTPLASVSGSGDEEEKEIVILELKTEKECEVWMEAIREHMKHAESE